jgi:2,3-diaminopropionate biosynthesis protein SbnA
MILPHALAHTGDTPLVQLTPASAEHVRFYAKLEDHNPTGSTKDRAAAHIIDRQLESGALTRDSLVLESSSGNFGIALAAYCAYRGVQFRCIIDPRITPINERLIRAFGAQVTCVTNVDDAGGYLRSRLAEVQSVLASTKHAYWVNQYANPLNAEAYFALAQELSADLDRIDYAFVGVSSGGTIAGVSMKLKERFPDVKIVAVDTVGSVIFGGAPRPRWIPGIGSSIVPEILAQAKIDDVVMVDERDAVKGCNELLEKHRLFNGGSSGAVYAAVKSYFAGKAFEVAPVVVGIFADRGERYADTIYDRAWCAKMFNAS